MHVRVAVMHIRVDEVKLRTFCLCVDSAQLLWVVLCLHGQKPSVDSLLSSLHLQLTLQLVTNTGNKSKANQLLLADDSCISRGKHALSIVLSVPDKCC